MAVPLAVGDLRNRTMTSSPVEGGDVYSAEIPLSLDGNVRGAIRVEILVPEGLTKQRLQEFLANTMAVRFTAG